MKYALALLLTFSVAAFAQNAEPNHQTLEGKAPATTIKPPVEWLQKYAIYLTDSSQLQALQAQIQSLQVKVQQAAKELMDDMDKPSKDCPAGCTLDAAKIEWTPKAKEK